MNDPLTWLRWINIRPVFVECNAHIYSYCSYIDTRVIKYKPTLKSDFEWKALICER